MIQTFLGNRKASNYRQLVDYLTQRELELWRAWSQYEYKNTYFYSHLDNFPENCGDVSDEQGTRFHQDIEVMGRGYQGRWNKRRIADHCWSFKRVEPYQHHSRKHNLSYRSFLE